MNKYLELLEDIFTTLREFIFSQQTLEKSRIKDTLFTRHRKMDFTDIVIFLLANFNGSLDSQLREFFSTFMCAKLPINEGDFSRSRNNISEYPFQKMFEIVRDKFVAFEKNVFEDFHELIHCAIDGSYLALPNFPRLGYFFGKYGKASGSINARMSLVFDSERHFIYEAVLAPLRYAERELALFTIKKLQTVLDLSKVVFIFDRGYPKLEFFEDLEELKTHFIIRSPNKWYGLSDLEAGRGYNLFVDKYPFPLRAVKIKIPGGEIETLITNLFSPSPEDFLWLYSIRWPIEIEYYFIKRVLRLEDFNGYSINSIYQNFWIAMTLSNIVSIFRLAANEIIDQESTDIDLEYKYQVNVSEIISNLHVRIIEILMEEDEDKRKRCIKDTLEQATRYKIPIRKNEKPRRSRSRIAFYHFNQKVH